MHADQILISRTQSSCPVRVLLSVSVRNHRVNIVLGQCHPGVTPGSSASNTAMRSSRDLPRISFSASGSKGGAGPEATHQGQHRSGNRASRRTASYNRGSACTGSETGQARIYIDVAVMWLDVIADCRRDRHSGSCPFRNRCATKAAN